MCVMGDAPDVEPLVREMVRCGIRIAIAQPRLLTGFATNPPCHAECKREKRSLPR